MTMTITDLRAKAESGSTVAQCILGITLLQGVDVEPDYSEAFRWLSRASENGAARATLHLGTMYEKGLFVAADALRARDLYQVAAKQGEFLGAVFLARILANGICGYVDEEAAVRWYRKAVSQEASVLGCPELDEARSYIASHEGLGSWNEEWTKPFT